MIEDQQTQTLPQVGPDLDRLAKFCGHPDTNDFELTLLEHMAKVEDHYAELFEEAPDLGGPSNLVFTGTEDDPGTVQSLQQMGFPDGSLVSGFVRDWHRGRYRATRSARARELLTELMPRLLQALAGTADGGSCDPPLRTISWQALPAGVQIFSLLYSNPGLLDLVAEIMGSAPLLADRLSRRPALLESVAHRRILRTGAAARGPEPGTSSTSSSRRSIRRRARYRPPLDQGSPVPDRRALAARKRPTARKRARR